MPEESQSNTPTLLSALTLNQKISMAIFALAVIAGVAGMVYVMNQEDYQVLYSDLGAEEARTVVDRLKALKVPYQLADSGKAVKVPAERIDEVRIQLASEGLPQGGKIGFEIFDRNSLGMTEFIERVSYKRALEGELVRTILSIKEIGEARVHLVLPKETIFEDKADPTKASVIIKLKSGKQLGQGVVPGIIHLVSSAVEGLTPSNVTVVDFNGRLLSGTPSSPDEALTGNQVELKARTEKELTAKAINILEPVVGQGKVKADTSVVMNFSRREQTEEKYDSQPVIRSQQKSEESSQPGAATPAAGVPGTQSNDANPPTFIPITKAAGTFKNQSETTNYEIGKLVQHTLEPVGAVEKISVAVIVDDVVRMEKDAQGAETRKTTPRSPEELKKLRDLVSAAVGIDAMRGDLLTIENIAFDVPADSVAGAAPAPAPLLEEWRNWIRPAVRYGAILIMFTLVYLLVVRPVTKKLLAPDAGAVSARQSSRELVEAALASPGVLSSPKTVKELEAALGGSLPSAIGGSDVTKSDVLKQRISDFVQREPEKGAQLLRSWLSQGGTAGGN